MYQKNSMVASLAFIAEECLWVGLRGGVSLRVDKLLVTWPGKCWCLRPKCLYSASFLPIVVFLMLSSQKSRVSLRIDQRLVMWVCPKSRAAVEERPPAVNKSPSLPPAPVPARSCQCPQKMPRFDITSPAWGHPVHTSR